MADLRERHPRGPGWELVDRDRLQPLLARWRSGRVLVVSALEQAELPDGAGVGPQWHVSVSGGGRRPKPHELRRALRAFGMVGAEEDNHHPGVARHFWMPVDPAHRVTCQCKDDEAVIVDADDGYRWTNPHEGEGECRGCELEGMTGAPCPLHPEEGAHV